jgi:hypothetical protein
MLRMQRNSESESGQKSFHHRGQLIAAIAACVLLTTSLGRARYPRAAACV